MKPVRIALCGLLAFGVLAHGGVEDWALAVFETGVGLVFFLWASFFVLFEKSEVVIPSVLPPLLAFTCVGGLQWIFHRTASPHETRLQLLLLLADVVFIFLAAQAFRTLHDWREFFWFAMLFGFFVAGLGILQHLTFNGKLYWFREMRYGGIPFGPYVNRNHFAGFAELAIPIALVPLILGKVRRERRFVIGLFALILIGALLLSASRGGIASLGVQLLLLVSIILLRRAGTKHLLTGGVVLVAALSLVSWLGVTQILSRFGSLQTLEVHEDKRASMRHGAWHIFLDHPVLGTGLGTLETVYLPYETLYDGKIVNHTHNDYLEALAETGILGGLCCAWFIALLLLAGLRSLQEPSVSFASALRLAGLTGCGGLLVHSLVDFNLHIPTNATFFFLMALLASSNMTSTQSQSPVTSKHRRSRNP
jgi:O-antigen ligase